MAVRVHSAGGSQYPGGLYDSQAPDMRQGALDPGASIGQKQTGYSIGNEGWYRRHFNLTAADAGYNISIRFDGVYMNSVVYLNGHFLGWRPYGYVTFEYDMTPYLKFAGSDNVLAVQVPNYGLNSRWYSGSGILRHVHLAKRPKVHVPLWGLHVQTLNIDLASGSTLLNVSDPLQLFFLSLSFLIG